MAALKQPGKAAEQGNQKAEVFRIQVKYSVKWNLSIKDTLVPR